MGTSTERARLAAVAVEPAERPDFNERKRIEARNWIFKVCKAKGWSPSLLARKSGVSPSTICRFVNDETNTNNLSWDTIAAVCQGSGEAIPDELVDSHGALAPDHARRRVGSRGRSIAILSETIPVLRISRFSEAIKPITGEQRRVPCPPELVGDETAFAFQMYDSSLAPHIPERSMIYCTRSREMVEGDLIVLVDRSGASRVGFCLGQNETKVRIEDESSDTGAFSLLRSGLSDFGIVRVVSLP